MKECAGAEPGIFPGIIQIMSSYFISYGEHLHYTASILMSSRAKGYGRAAVSVTTALFLGYGNEELQ